ncbi:MAG TPA: LLM class flavin-dependent oxidoreductase [Candidatus Dormibacteraeota bacterium]|nr:LLM class flavin-dependent oxidoreductase [Candidatus Dormibacteraeota bacterium]
MSELRLGCFVPQGWRSDLPRELAPTALWDAMTAVAVRAERSGYGAVWVYDHLQSVFPEDRSPVLDPLLSLARLASATSQVRLGTMCLALPLHRPAILAHQLALLDGMSGGRVEVGIGAGSSPSEGQAFGVPFPSLRERIMACGEAAELLRACWGHDVTHFEGRYSVVEDAAIYPKPIQRPGPPIWIAGGGERLTLWQVARHADGCSLFGPPSRVARKLDLLAEHCRSLGRPLESVRVAVVLDCLVADSDAAADHLAERHNRHREDPSAYRARRLVGSPVACAQQLQEYLDLGVSEVCCYFPDAVRSDSLERLAHAVLGTTH